MPRETAPLPGYRAAPAPPSAAAPRSHTTWRVLRPSSAHPSHLAPPRFSFPYLPRIQQFTRSISLLLTNPDGLLELLGKVLRPAGISPLGFAVLSCDKCFVFRTYEPPTVFCLVLAEIVG